MVTEYPHLDRQVTEAISKIDSYIKAPKSPPTLDAELNALLDELEKESTVISQNRNSSEMTYHVRRINRLRFYMVKYEEAKKNITKNTRAGLVNVTTRSDQGDTESLEASGPLIDLKNSLEKESKTPMTVASLTQSLQPLEKEKDPLARTIILNTAWSRLSQQGYNMTIQCGTIGLENPDNK